MIFPRTYEQLSRDEQEYADRFVTFTERILADWRKALRVQTLSRLKYEGEPILRASWVVEFRHEDNHEIRGGMSVTLYPREFENGDYGRSLYRRGALTWLELVERADFPNPQ